MEFVEDLTKEAADQRWEEVCSDAKLGQAPSNTAVWTHWGLSGKLIPLIVYNLNTGAVAMESMVGCKAENVFMALQRLQFRFGTEIVQAFTDKGSQLGKILGDTKDYWSAKLGGKMKVFNNLASCQYRNVCKRKVRTFM